MNDLGILDNLFQKHNDEIHFELFKRSNIVWINNENKGDYNKEIIFNTRSLASLLINYKDAYILLKIEVKIPYDQTDQGKKMSEINENFYVNNVQNCDSVYMYGILNTNKEGLKYDLPSVKFEKPHLNIDNIEFEKPIDNDISAYYELKSKSNHYDNFLITYRNFKSYHRIYCFNVARNIRDDHNNKFINIITNMETTSCTVYVVLKTHSSVKLEYSKSNGLIVYKSQ